MGCKIAYYVVSVAASVCYLLVMYYSAMLFLTVPRTYARIVAVTVFIASLTLLLGTLAHVRCIR